jgi:hypothetical protein
MPGLSWKHYSVAILSVAFRRILCVVAGGIAIGIILIFVVKMADWWLVSWDGKREHKSIRRGGILGFCSCFYHFLDLTH